MPRSWSASLGAWERSSAEPAASAERIEEPDRDRDLRPSTAALAASMVDPLNRLYRYPIARWLTPHAVRMRVTPDQVTYAHAAVGVAAAWFVVGGSRQDLIVAGVLFEAHLILDCLDGVLARATGTSTVRGRTLDALADAVAYLALCAALLLRVRATHPDFPAAAVTAGLISTGAIAAWAHDFYLRKLSSALRSGRDGICDDLVVRRRAIDAGRAGFVTWFGYAFDWWQITVLDPASRRQIAARVRARATPRSEASPGVRHVRDHAHGTQGRRALRAVSLMSNDNSLAILTLGLLTGFLATAQLAAMLYAAVATVAGVVLCRRFLAGAHVHRE